MLIFLSLYKMAFVCKNNEGLRQAQLRSKKSIGKSMLRKSLAMYFELFVQIGRVLCLLTHMYMCMCVLSHVRIF